MNREEIEYQTAKAIYDELYENFFSNSMPKVIFRMNHGMKGAAERTLKWIWENYIEKKESDS